jgi:hypothetical protein
MEEAADPISPRRMAALVAPEIDRLRVAIMQRAVGPAIELANAIGLSDEGGRIAAMLRNTLPQRVVTDEQVQVLFRYVPTETVDTGIGDALAAGVLTRPNRGKLHFTPRGQRLAIDVYRATEALVKELWAQNIKQLEALMPLTAKALAAAVPTGGPAFSVVATPYEPEGASPAMIVAERLTPLRFHRFDAHIEAWQQAGMSVEEVQSLTDGPRREAVEEQTNRLSAAPYAALDPWERVEMIGGLGALPN